MTNEEAQKLPDGLRPLTENDFKIGRREKELLRALFDWGEESKKCNRHVLWGDIYKKKAR